MDRHGVDFARVFDAAPAPYLLLDPDLTIVAVNRAYREATARRAEDVLGRALFDAYPQNPDDPVGDGVSNLRASLERARATGLPDSMPVQKYDIPTPDGSFVERYWSPVNVPVLDAAGRVALLLHRVEDVTDYVRDRDAARLEVARGQQWRERVDEVEADLVARARELAEVNQRLRDSVERERRTGRLLAGMARTAMALTTAQTVADLSAIVIDEGLAAMGADGGAVALREGDRLHLALTSSLGEEAAARFTDVPMTSALPVAAAARGQQVLLRDEAASLAWAPEMAEAVAATGLTAWAALPLRAGGTALGALVIGWRDAQRFEPEEVEVLDAFAAQCAQALDRVSRLAAERDSAERTRALAEALQRSLLTEPPQPDHLQIAVRYQPAQEDAQVGGDWYDAFIAPGGATVLAIGDVSGHDQVAAAAMAQVRNLLRGVAHALASPPAAVLSGLDAALADLRVGTLATTVLVQVEQDAAEAAAGLRTLRWASAGHPPPLLVSPDGTARLLEHEPDLLLGLDPATPRRDHAVVLGPGTTAVLYTDGLVERRGEDLAVGLARLADAAAGLSGLGLEELCDGLLAALGRGAQDDIALIAVRAHPEDRPRPDAATPR